MLHTDEAGAEREQRSAGQPESERPAELPGVLFAATTTRWRARPQDAASRGSVQGAQAGPKGQELLSRPWKGESGKPEKAAPQTRAAGEVQDIPKERRRRRRVADISCMLPGAGSVISILLC